MWKRQIDFGSNEDLDQSTFIYKIGYLTPAAPIFKHNPKHSSIIALLVFQDRSSFMLNPSHAFPTLRSWMAYAFPWAERYLSATKPKDTSMLMRTLSSLDLQQRQWGTRIVSPIFIYTVTVNPAWVEGSCTWAAWAVGERRYLAPEQSSDALLEFDRWSPHCLCYIKMSIYI